MTPADKFRRGSQIEISSSKFNNATSHAPGSGAVSSSPPVPGGSKAMGYVTTGVNPAGNWHLSNFSLLSGDGKCTGGVKHGHNQVPTVVRFVRGFVHYKL